MIIHSYPISEWKAYKVLKNEIEKMIMISDEIYNSYDFVNC